MASGCHFVFFLSLISGLFTAGTMSDTDNSDQQAQFWVPVSGCPAGWTQFGSRCFIFYKMHKTWLGAEQTCISIGGNLASIHTTDENAFIRELIKRVTGSYLPTWIGGFDTMKEGTWLWSDGSKFDYRRWRPGQPNNAQGNENCLEMNFKGNYWNDRPCVFEIPFVCVKDL